jgi:hypothetical protein
MVVPWPPIADAAPFISAGAGVAGVIVALSGDLVRRHWQRPKLRLLPFRANKGDDSYLDIPDGSHEAWLRLGVHNDGREAARNVEVCIEDITLDEPTPDEQRLRAFQKQRLQGVMGRPLSWANRDEGTLDIPPGTIRRIDIAHVVRGKPCYAIDDGLAVPIRFALHGGSRRNHDIVAGLHYSLRLSLSASNCQTAMFDIQLEFGGKWLGPETVNPLVLGSLRVVHMSRSRSL